MAITTRDALIDALANNSSRIIFDKASIASQAAGSFVSLWRATGQPGQGAIPGAAAVCNNVLTGAIQFTQQTSPATSYLAQLEGICSNSAMSFELHDRLAHMGGLSGTVTTAQTVGIDFSSLSGSNLTERIGSAAYDDIQWWLEWYTATGATAVTATVAVTYNDGSTGTLSASLAATRPASFMLPLNGLIPSAAAGKYIRAVTSVTLSATTGTAGSFGVTATRFRGALSLPLANFKPAQTDWAQLGLSQIFNSSCIFAICVTSTTSTGTFRATGKIAHG